MNSKLTQTLIAGIAGTVAMTVLTFMGPYMGLPEMTQAGMLSSMMGVSMTVGWIMHFMIGIVFAAGYVFLFSPRVNISNKLLKGAAFGFTVFIVAAILMMGMGAMMEMPEPEGSMMPMMIGSLMYHLIYGITVGVVAKSSTETAATETTATESSGGDSSAGENPSNES